MLAHILPDITEGEEVMSSHVVHYSIHHFWHLLIRLLPVTYLNHISVKWGYYCNLTVSHVHTYFVLFQAYKILDELTDRRFKTGKSLKARRKKFKTPCSRWEVIYWNILYSARYWERERESKRKTKSISPPPTLPAYCHEVTIPPFKTSWLFWAATLELSPNATSFQKIL